MMAADGPKEVDEKQFADLRSRCKVNICCLMLHLLIYIFGHVLCSFLKLMLHEPVSGTENQCQLSSASKLRSVT